MEFKKLSYLLDNPSDMTLINNLASDNINNPSIIDKILSLISDDTDIPSISNDNRLKLYRLCREYFNTCWNAFIDYSSGSVRLSNLIEYSKSVVYHTMAANGERVATANEVKSGVMELKITETDNIEPHIVSNLYLLLWTFTGKLTYYKKAGLEYTYENNQLVESDYTLINRAGLKLRELIDWMYNRADYERTIAVLRAYKKRGKYMYPEFAHDEIKPELSIKQIQFVCMSKISRDTNVPEQIAARKVAYRMNKSRYNPLPHEIALMRLANYQIENHITKIDNKPKLSPEIESLCGKIMMAESEGVISSDRLAISIVKTINRTGRCSDKQLAVLKNESDRIDKINDKKVKPKREIKKEEPVSDEYVDEMMTMYDVLGLGGLEG